MRRSLPILTLAAAALAAAAIVMPASASTGRAKVELSSTKLGKVLADGHGHTLYLFEKDRHAESACFSACAHAWPPLLTSSTPTAGSGVSASKLGTTNRGNGVKQVTYNGHPVYRFVKDTRARQTNGEGLKAFGAEWYALSAAGRKVDKD